jgi:DNA-binding HxlR family transcriptional regulator
MKYCYYNPKNCTVTAAMEFIGGKWKLIILYVLMGRTMRFGRIKSYIPAISGKVLTSQLKELELDGLLVRVVVSQQPKEVEYSLTSMGSGLYSITSAIDTWGKKKLKAAI